MVLPYSPLSWWVIRNDLSSSAYVKAAQNAVSVLWRKPECMGASLVAQTVKNPPAMRETWVWSLGREDALEEDMATHSSVLAWRVPWTEEPGGLQSTGSPRAGHDWATNSFISRGAEILPASWSKVQNINNRSNIVRNSVRTFQMIRTQTHTKKICKKIEKEKTLMQITLLVVEVQSLSHAQGLWPHGL